MRGPNGRSGAARAIWPILGNLAARFQSGRASSCSAFAPIGAAHLNPALAVRRAGGAADICDVAALALLRLNGRRFAPPVVTFAQVST